MHRIVVVDYGMGNIGSIVKKLRRVDGLPFVTAEGKDIASASKIVLPGVGHFSAAVKNLEKNGIWDALNEAVIHQKVPILGICLGMQLMAKHSEEGDVDGFGWFDAEVVKFQVKDKLKYKVPHTGWNQITQSKESSLMKNVPDFSEFYFVHSYYFKCNNPADVLNETEYECSFVSAIEKDNIFGVQYHPEKSHEIGELVLKNFVNL